MSYPFKVLMHHKAHCERRTFEGTETPETLWLKREIIIRNSSTWNHYLRNRDQMVGSVREWCRVRLFGIVEGWWGEDDLWSGTTTSSRKFKQFAKTWTSPPVYITFKSFQTSKTIPTKPKLIPNLATYCFINRKGLSWGFICCLFSVRNGLNRPLWVDDKGKVSNLLAEANNL
jgi:hypothetical protein